MSRKRDLASVDALDDDWWLRIDPVSEKEHSKDKKVKVDDVQVSCAAATDSKLKKSNKKKKKIDRSASSPSVRKQFLSILCTTAKLTPIEVDDIKLKASCFLKSNLSALDGDGTAIFGSYLKEVAPQWQNNITSYASRAGNPIMITITSSAVRAIDLNRVSANFRKNCRSIKLFAKHIKVQEQKQLLKKKVHFAIGTPNRIHKLINEDCLQLDGLKYVIFDWNHRDVKNRRLIDIPEIRQDLVQLSLTCFIPLAKEGKIKIGLF